VSSLEVRNFSVGYDKLLIQNLNLTLDIGQRLIIYGSNGTGKSTLLNALAQNRNPQFIQWAIPSDQVLFLRQQTSFHTQTPDDVQSYLINILLYKKPFSRVSSKDLELIQSVQDKLYLPNMPLKNLSGGQRQKLRMAQGLLMKTQVLLLDEPFNAIDQTSSQEIIHWLNDIKDSTLQILVLHDFEQIEQLKSPVLWIQPDSWEILEFDEWFRKVDHRFHSWMHTMKKPGIMENSGTFK
jgi:ABC-type Mn2+/Zn2+ transport system ATPase subunit